MTSLVGISPTWPLESGEGGEIFSSRDGWWPFSSAMVVEMSVLGRSGQKGLETQDSRLCVLGNRSSRVMCADIQSHRDKPVYIGLPYAVRSEVSDGDLGRPPNLLALSSQGSPTIIYCRDDKLGEVPIARREGDLEGRELGRLPTAGMAYSIGIGMSFIWESPSRRRPGLM